MDWEPGYQERFPEWRSSEGALKEQGHPFIRKEKGKGQETKEALTGYESSEKEKKQKDEPRKIWELGNSFGSLAVGKNKKKQLMIVNSQRRGKRLRALPPESKTLHSETGKKIPLISGEFRFNEDWNRREESAYSYQLEASRSPDYLMRKMKELNEKRRLNVRDNINPFFNLQKEQDELRWLREKAAEMARGADRDREKEKGLQTRIQFLSASLAEKERERLRFYTKLPQLLEEARKEEIGDWIFASPLRTIREVASDEEGDESSGQEEAKGAEPGDTDKSRASDIPGTLDFTDVR